MPEGSKDVRAANFHANQSRRCYSERVNGGEMMRSTPRHARNTFAKALLFAFLGLPLLLPAQYQEGNGIIDMDGERFAPEDPREKAEWTFVRFHYDLDFGFGRFRFQRWAADYPEVRSPVHAGGCLDAADASGCTF